jgi:hypothetical protein
MDFLNEAVAFYHFFLLYHIKKEAIFWQVSFHTEHFIGHLVLAAVNDEIPD